MFLEIFISFIAPTVPHMDTQVCHFIGKTLVCVCMHTNKIFLSPGGREGEREGGREGEREGEREGGMEGEMGGEEWRNGGMEKWRNGGMEEWKVMNS